MTRTRIFQVRELLLPWDEEEALQWKALLEPASGLSIYTRSFTLVDGRLYFLGRREDGKWLGILAARPPQDFDGAARQISLHGGRGWLFVGPASAHNAALLRTRVSFLVPQPLGLKKSVGCGDRLGLATPGHVRAVRKHSMAPIFAQQSIREMERTGRTPQQVMDDAMGGIFQEGWRGGFGADADHLKSFEHVDLCVKAGFTFFTVDPGDYVNNAANTAPPASVRKAVEALPWDTLDASEEKLRALYLGRTFDLGIFSLRFSEETLWRAAAKYGWAVAHTVRMYRYIRSKLSRPFELEMSVDETDSPTSIAEHVFIASELRRLGVEWVSLAPRFVGRFEKGVDYIGDLEAFSQSFRQHVAVAQALGPYKLSLHSGSDKFSIYPVVARWAGEYIHLKTAGTSYLVALEIVARYAPDLFREILAFARERYPIDRATYHVSADLSRVPDPKTLTDDELPQLLHDFHGRQVLHVTFGSVLTARTPDGTYKFRDRLRALLWEHEEDYSAALEAHFDKHLAPFDA